MTIQFDTNEQLREYIDRNALRPSNVQVQMPMKNTDTYLVIEEHGYITVSHVPTSFNIVHFTMIEK